MHGVVYHHTVYLSCTYQQMGRQLCIVKPCMILFDITESMQYFKLEIKKIGIVTCKFYIFPMMYIQSLIVEAANHYSLHKYSWTPNNTIHRGTITAS